MAKYNVTLETLVRSRAVVEVEADSEAEAYEKAEAEAPTLQFADCGYDPDVYEGTDCELLYGDEPTCSCENDLPVEQCPQCWSTS